MGKWITDRLPKNNKEVIITWKELTSNRWINVSTAVYIEKYSVNTEDEPYFKGWSELEYIKGCEDAEGYAPEGWYLTIYDSVCHMAFKPLDYTEEVIAWQELPEPYEDKTERK